MAALHVDDEGGILSWLQTANPTVGVDVQRATIVPFAPAPSDTWGLEARNRLLNGRSLLQ